MVPANIGREKYLKLVNRNFSNVIVSFVVIFSIILSILSPSQLMAVSASEDGFTSLAEIRTYIQQELDKMSDNIVVKTEGLEIAKLFLITDNKGNISEPITFNSLYADIFSEKIRDMNPMYFNSYTYLALSGWEIEVKVSYTKTGNIINTANISIDYHLFWREGSNALDKRNAVATHAKSFLNSPEYLSKSTDDEKLKAINEFINRTFQYDYRLFIQGRQNEVIYTAFQMISDTGNADRHVLDKEGYPRGVCQAYTMYAYIMLREAGYDVIAIEGNPDKVSGLNTHVWNLVKIGSFWYHIDFTWNDPVREIPSGSGFFIQDSEGVLSLNYLLRSDVEMGKSHVWDKSIYPAALQKWEGIPEIIDETPPPTAPPIATPTPVITISPIPSPTPVISVTPSVTPTKAPSSSGSDESIISESKTLESGMDNSSAEASSVPPTATPLPINMVPDESDVLKSTGTEKTVTISGFLQNEKGEALSGMLVELFATSMTRRTTSKGYFEFKDVKVGNYKLYIKDNEGNEIAELPVVISFGDITEYDSGEITVKGGRLDMNLILDNGRLSIKCVSSPKPFFTIPVIIGIISIILLAAAFIALFTRRKEGTGVSEYLD